ncbi:hypothetical protein D3C83_108720 [compost metagenome]
MDEIDHANHRRRRKRERRRFHQMPVRFEHLGLAVKDQQDRAPHVADIERFVILIEN